MSEATTYDWMKHAKAAKRELRKCGFNVDHVFYHVPDENGEMVERGPTTFDDAVKKMRDYWESKHAF